MPGPAPIPLTLIGGFLGSGKTTLLNNLLHQASGVRYAVLVNDFGDLAIDDALITAHEGETITLANGCVCCSIGNDLMAALASVTNWSPTPDHIVIEASGVADPGRIRDIAYIEPQLRACPVVVLVDAAQIRGYAEDPNLEDTVDRQLNAADILVLNKVDLVSDLDATRDWLVEQCPATPIIQCAHGNVPAEMLLEGDLVSNPVAHAGDLISESHRSHVFKAVTLESPSPTTQSFIEKRLQALPKSVLRVKGFIQFETPANQMYLVQMSGDQIDISPCATSPETLQLVIIGTRDLPDTAWFERFFEAER